LNALSITYFSLSSKDQAHNTQELTFSLALARLMMLSLTILQVINQEWGGNEFVSNFKMQDGV